MNYEGLVCRCSSVMSPSELSYGRDSVAEAKSLVKDLQLQLAKWKVFHGVDMNHRDGIGVLWLCGAWTGCPRASDPWCVAQFEAPHYHGCNCWAPPGPVGVPTSPWYSTPKSWPLHRFYTAVACIKSSQYPEVFARECLEVDTLRLFGTCVDLEPVDKCQTFHPNQRSQHTCWQTCAPENLHSVLLPGGPPWEVLLLHLWNTRCPQARAHCLRWMHPLHFGWPWKEVIMDGYHKAWAVAVSISHPCPGLQWNQKVAQFCVSPQQYCKEKSTVAIGMLVLRTSITESACSTWFPGCASAVVSVFSSACLSALLSSWTSVLCSGGCKQHDSKVYVESQHRVKPRGPNLSMSQHIGPVSAGSPMKHFSTGTTFTMLQPVFTSWSSRTVPSCGGCKQHDSKV